MLKLTRQGAAPSRGEVCCLPLQVLVTIESPEYETAALISDIGGQLGLWIGASLITAAEILEFVWHVLNKFFDVRTCSRRRRSRPRPDNDDV